MAELAQALLVTRKIRSAFWDRGLHPAADNGDLDDRASALSWLDEKLALVVSSVTFATRNDGGRSSYNDFLDAHRGSKKKYVKPNGDIDENLKKAFDQAIKSGHVSSTSMKKPSRVPRAHAEATLATFEVAAKDPSYSKTRLPRNSGPRRRPLPPRVAAFVKCSRKFIAS